MTNLICYVNGDFLAIDEAALSVQDLAILRGYGVFDFFRTYHGKPFKLPEHLRRLERSAKAIWLPLPATLVEIETIVKETVQRNSLPEANVRIVVTGGVSSDGISATESASLVVLVTPPKQYPATYYEKGIKAITVDVERYMPLAKTINYIPAIMAQKQAQTTGAVEALYVDRHNNILEGTTTNFFVFQADTLITPLEGILPGVTRDVVLELAQQRFEVVERKLTFADLSRADEAFITASNKEVMPVCLVNDIQIGAGQVGPKTHQIRDDFYQATWG